MKKVYIAIFSALILSTALSSCSKYDEGPGLSFRSAAERMTNDWEVKVILEDDQDISYYYQDWTLEIREDGRFSVSDLDLQDSVVTLNGFWSLINDKESILFIYADPPVDPDRRTYKIRKLKEDEVWLWETNDSSSIDLRMITKGSSEE